MFVHMSASFHFFQGQLKNVYPKAIGSPPPGWWIKIYVGGLLKVDYNGPGFLESSGIQIHREFVKEVFSLEVSEGWEVHDA